MVHYPTPFIICMCTNTRYITNCYNQKILVNCGLCPACLQEKAIKRSTLIRNSFPADTVALFVTLTYKNAFIPYIDYDYVERILKSCKDSVINVPVWRDYDVNHYRIGKSRKTHEVLYENDSPLFNIKIRRNHWYASRSQFKFLRNSPSKHIGVCYFVDIQNFLKRLRQVLKRNYSNYEIPFKSFQVSEIGPTTLRPHFHLLILVSLRYVSLVKSACVTAWSYADKHRTFKNIEVARNAASYVSSYVNCHNYVPNLFKIYKEFRPKSSHSKDMGFDKYAFSFLEVLKAFNRRNLVYYDRDPRTGSVASDPLPLPSNVIGRYFPKIKGFCRLTNDEILSIYSGRAPLECYAWRLSYTPEQVIQFKSLLSRKRRFAKNFGLSGDDFGFVASQIWNIRKSNSIKSQFQSIRYVSDYFQLYDNISEFYDLGVKAPTLLPFIWNVSKLETDPNKFTLRVSKTKNLESWFDTYDKSKKVRSHVYSMSHDDF